MSIGIKIDNIITEIGTADFLHAFFSTVSYNLEQGGWGSRFPTLLNDLYQGSLEKSKSKDALSELKTIEIEFSKIPPSKVVWDIEDINKTPPWGGNISIDIKNLADYFVTSTGKNLLEVLRESLDFLDRRGTICKIVSI